MQEITILILKECESSNSEPWLVMSLRGRNDIDGPTECTTEFLDHANKIDFEPGAETFFEGVSDMKLLGDCYLVIFKKNRN